MCLAVPYKIISIEGNKAKANLFGAEKEIDVRIVDDIDKNDYVLVHAGFAIQKVDEKEANETLDLLRELSDIQ
ncbi:MAG: HypC/HybG/HupF family hydrogenase formation chaperone [Candidatus Cloacimonetes bacterium]|nr:HypC/HybG/HupF family hydrogenase formation chaperone [Candidatus Cloacimonadota bacterium]MBS3767770.1 HypC/HybG/HupF family hydrogenase formation chaperone [Candidatus Cloacimonadota bacterium]